MVSLVRWEVREVLKDKQCTRGIHVTLFNNVATFSDWEVRGGFYLSYAFLNIGKSVSPTTAKKK